MSYRILACGDNHGDTESLERLVEQTAGEKFDFIIHTGDITNAYKKDLQKGVEQLQAVEPYFETLAERGTLIYIYGNRDKERGFGDSVQHVTDKYELSVGRRLRAGEEITVKGQRFTADPENAGPEDILLTHGISHREFFSPSARAYFCGDTHRARQFRNALNTGYLHNDKGFNGAYFIATLAENAMDVSVHGIDEPWKGFICSDHEWYGRQFTPQKFGCGICKFGPVQQFRQMVSIVFETTANMDDAGDAKTATVDELVTEAREVFVDSDQFAQQFRSYLSALADNEVPSPMDPLAPVQGKPNYLRRPSGSSLV